jgi:hypothetical protein
MVTKRLALYTTVYPGVEPYLAVWHESVRNQTDSDFDLYIGLDSISPDELMNAIGRDPCATLISVAPGSSPAQIRNTALEALVDDYEAIVLVDSDDVLDPLRVSSARAATQTSDLSGCALRLIDEAGHDLGIRFGPASSISYDVLLARHNIFGLSNSAYRAHILKRCLPIPTDCVLIDWLLAIRASATGASLTFDFTPRMAYRRHTKNVTPLVPPFLPEDVLRATRLVLAHYRIVLSDGLAEGSPYWSRIKLAYRRAALFQHTMSNDQNKLKRYVGALNELDPEYVWWWCVAHSELEEIWRN